jgi:hypothetical protein
MVALQEEMRAWGEEMAAWQEVMEARNQGQVRLGRMEASVAKTQVKQEVTGRNRTAGSS